MIESLVLALIRQTEAGQSEAGQDFLVPEPEGLSQLGLYCQNLLLAPGSSLSVGCIILTRNLFLSLEKYKENPSTKRF